MGGGGGPRRASWGDLGGRTGGLWEHRELVLHTTSLELLCSHSVGMVSPGGGFGERVVGGGGGEDVGTAKRTSWVFWDNLHL